VEIVTNNCSVSESSNNGSDVDSVAELLVPQAIAMSTTYAMPRLAFLLQ